MIYMNTKTIKLLSVLAVLAMAFVVVAAISPAQGDDAADGTTTIHVNAADQVVYANWLNDKGEDQIYDTALYDSYKISSMSYDSDGIPTYTVTAKGLKTHQTPVEAGSVYGNWAGAEYVAPDTAEYYASIQVLKLTKSIADYKSDLVEANHAVDGYIFVPGVSEKTVSGDFAPKYPGIGDLKSAQDYYQIFVWSTAEITDADQIATDDILIFHIILNVTPQADALKLTEASSVKGVLDNGVKITGDFETEFIEYTGTITVGKNVLTADNFTGTITSSDSETTAAVEITTWTAGDLEVTTGNYEAATSSPAEVFYVTLAANARDGASANSTLYVPSGQYLYTEMTATFDDTNSKELNIANNGTINFGDAIALTGSVVNDGTIIATAGAVTFGEAAIVSGNGTFKVGDQNVTIPGGTFANNIVITQTYAASPAASQENVKTAMKAAIEANPSTWPAENRSVTISPEAIYAGTITYEQKYTYESTKTGTYATFKAEMNVEAAAGGLTVTTGSLTIAGYANGEYSQSYFSGYSDDIFVGALTINNGSFTFNGNVTLNGDLTLDDATVNVSKEADLTIGDEQQIILDETSILYVDGTVSLDNLEQDADPITGPNGAVVKVSDTGVLNPVIITNLPATVKLVTEGGMEIQYVYDTALGVHDYPANQILIVDGTWTLANTAVINVSGRLIVPAGSTLIVEAGAILNIDNKAQFIVEGTLNIDEAETEAGAAGIVSINEGEMTVSGTVSDAGEVNLSQDMVLTILEGGKFTVESDGKVVTATGSEFTVSAGAELIVKGCIDGVEISNMGSVLINSSYPAQSEARINHLLKDAVTEVKLYTIEAGAEAGLIISDEDLRISSYRDTETHETKYVTINDFNSILIEGELFNGTATVVDDDYNVEVSNIIVTSDSDKDSSTVTMFVKGTLQANYAYVGDSVGVTTYTPRAAMTASAGVAGASLKVTDSLRITDNSGFQLVRGNMYLTGTITTQSSLAAFVMSEDATLTVTDDGIARIFGTAISSEMGVNATKIIIPVVEDNKTVKVYTYMSVDKALEYLASAEDAVGEANVLGNQTMKASSTLGGEDVLIVSGKLTIGEKNGDDVKLTIAEDSTLKGAGYVYVNGTLYAEDKSDVKIKDSYISADVKTVQVDDKGKEVKNGWAKWTNVLTAIKETEQGDVIITRDGASTTLPKYVYVTSNLTIPEGVNLVIPTGAADLILNDGVTLVIDGSVKIGAGANIKAQTAFNLVAYKITSGTKAYSSAIVVNGSLTTAYKVAFADGTYGTSSNTEEGAYVALVNKNNPAWGAPIAGAYYALSNGNYVISGMETAIAQLDKIDGDITINGNVKAGVTDFTATEYTKNIIVNNANVKYKEYEAGTPNIKTVFTVLALNIECPDGISAAKLQANGEFNGMIVTDKSEISAIGVTGMTVTAKYNKAAVVTGSFEMSGKGDSFMVSSGEVVFNAITPVMSAANVNNAVDIAAGAKLTIDGTTTLENVFVYGTLNVPATKTLTVNGTIVVDGNVTVAQQTATAAPGTFKLDNGDMYIGITGKDMNNGEAVAAAAVYSGPLTLVNNPCVFVLNGATVSGGIVDVLDDMYSTAFVVEGKVWFTAYAKADTETVTVSKVPVSNAVLEGWASTADGSRIDFNPNEGVNYYTPTIGTWDVLYAVLEYDLYQIYILADQGVHNISIDGKLMQSAAYGTDVFYMNGIDAGTHEVTYTLLDGYQGTAVMKLQKSDNTVTLFGLNFTISGDEAGVTYLQLTGIEPADPVTPEEKSEWTITTILLVILVILIAVMAVIVALRLNRS